MPKRTLSLLRHGDALPATPGADDFQRQLSERGSNDIHRLLHWSIQHDLKADWIYASPATRTQSSARPFAEAWACPQIDLTELYLADPHQLLDCLRQTPDDIQHVLLVGHNPGLSYLASDLEQQQQPSSLPAAGLVSFSFTAEWVDLTLGCADRTLILAPTDY